MILFDISPLLSTNNCTNTSTTNAKDFPKFILRIITCTIKFSYFYHIFFCYLCRTTSRAIDMIKSMLTHAISHIVFLCSKKKMMRITTSRMIALMKNSKFVRYISISQFPSYYMGIIYYFINVKFPISISITKQATSFPFPAFIRAANVNFTPKTFFNRFFTFRHMASLIGATPGKADFLSQSSRQGWHEIKYPLGDLCDKIIIPQKGHKR